MKNDNKTKVDKIYRQINKIAIKGKDYALEYNGLVDDIINRGQYGYLELCLVVKYGFYASQYKYIEDLKKESWKTITLKTNSSLAERLMHYYRSKKVYQIGNEIHTDDVNYAGLTWSGPMDSEYTSVATASQVSFAKDSSSMVGISIADSLIYKIEISRVNWKSIAPTDIRQVQKIQSGTYSALPLSYYVTQIPLTHGDYLVTAYKREDISYSGDFANQYSVFNYRVSVSNGVLLGTIREVDSVPYSENYYYLDRKFAELTKMKKTFLEVTNLHGNTITVLYDSPNKSEESNLYQRYVLAIEYLLS